MYDLIIIGAGPAGMSAAIYAARKKLKLLILTKDIGGKAAWSGKVDNYPSYQLITGEELSHKFDNHVKSFGVEMKEAVSVSKIKKEEHGFTVTAGEVDYRSISVLIATGTVPETLDVSQEAKFRNHGVSYCSASDAPLFTGKDVAVVGGDESAIGAALQLSRIAHQIYLINPADVLKGDPITVGQADMADNIEIINNAKISMLFGEDSVTGIKVMSDSGEKRLDVSGVFIEMGFSPTNLDDIEVDEKIGVNDNGEIIINDRCETNVSGIFAAGDVTHIPDKHIVIAAGHGALAALNAARYVTHNWKKE